MMARSGMTAEPALQLTKLDDGTYVDVVFSACDGGWYAQRHGDNLTTEIYDTVAALRLALAHGAARFRD